MSLYRFLAEGLSGEAARGRSGTVAYPGGFSLRSAGLDVRGRSFVLRTNWRNTQRISDAARLVLGPQGIRDLERE